MTGHCYPSLAYFLPFCVFRPKNPQVGKPKIISKYLLSGVWNPITILDSFLLYYLRYETPLRSIIAKLWSLLMTRRQRYKPEHLTEINKTKLDTLPLSSTPENLARHYGSRDKQRNTRRGKLCVGERMRRDEEQPRKPQVLYTKGRTRLQKRRPIWTSCA